MNLPDAFVLPRSGRIPTLDGLRAVAIGLVIAAHALGTGVLPMDGRLAGFAGDLGVRSFFVLSGFLITTLLIREANAQGTISLGRFYLRRACRIFPAFYAYLFVVALLAVAGAIQLKDGDLFAAATYTMNFHADRSWEVGHLWSLAVEEQFYLLWPLVLVTVGMTRAWWAVAAVFAAPLFRIALWRWFPQHSDLTDQAFPCVFDALATGCVLAVAIPALTKSAACRRFVESRWLWIVPVMFIATLAIRNPWLRLGPAMTLANIGIALVILRCIARPNHSVGRVLERPSLVWVGGLSYSLYLWQQLFLNRHSELWFHQFPINIVFAFATAVACHYAIERPFLRLNERWRFSSEPDRPLAASMLSPSFSILDVSQTSNARTSTTLRAVPERLQTDRDEQ